MWSDLIQWQFNFETKHKNLSVVILSVNLIFFLSQNDVTNLCDLRQTCSLLHGFLFFLFVLFFFIRNVNSITNQNDHHLFRSNEITIRLYHLA